MRNPCRSSSARRALVVAAALGLLLAACGSSSSSSSSSGGSSSANTASSGSSGSSSSKNKGTLTICEIAANSGPFTQLGTNDELGATAWAYVENHSGGLDGYTVKLVKENDNSDPATAAGLVRKCVTQVHANVIFGPEETSTAAAAIPVANELRVITLGWQSGWTGQGVTGSNLTGYAFPGIGNVFYSDDLATVQYLIAPRHYKRVAVIQDNAPGGLGNNTYTASLGPKYGFKVVASQTVTPGATDDTPEVLKLLAAHPQIIVLGMIPGADTITAIKAIRAQDPTIPISECSGCSQPSFIAAVGGASAMKNVYLNGAYNSLEQLPDTPEFAGAIAGNKAYIAGMKAAGLGSLDDLNGGLEGWVTGQELQNAVTTAGSDSTSALLNALRHQKMMTGGTIAYYWARTPTNYANMTRIVQAMVTVGPGGKLQVVPPPPGV